MTRCKNRKKLVRILGMTMFLGIGIPMTVNAGTASVNMSNQSKDYKITKTSDEYHFFGNSKKQSIIVDCNGTVNIYLEGVNLNDDDKAGIHIKKGSSVNLYLEDGSYNYLYGGDNQAGLQVDEGATVTILGNGELESIGSGKRDHGAAGIGSAYDESSGKIIIGNDKYCPIIKATSGDGGAGIGSGEDGRCDDGIYIYNGNITATGTNGGAGIGGGDAVGAGDGGETKTIMISGGTVTATGGSGAAGIGGSDSGSSGSGGDVSDIKITGGTIVATGGKNGAGVGGGQKSEVTNLRIEDNGTLNLIAQGGENGAGIGNSGNGSDSIESIYIKLNGGNITAKGGKYGAGIGGGNSGADKIEIYGKGTITAEGFEHSAAIGAGKDEPVGDIIIEGSSGGRNLVINAKTTKDRGANDAAVIGAADSKGGNITIKNAHLTLWSTMESQGTAIGVGLNTSVSPGGMGTITIENCYIKDDNYQNRKAASIGAGFSSEINYIKIKDSEIYGGSIGSTHNGNQFIGEPTIKGISITNSTVHAHARNGQRAGIGSGCYAGIEDITIIDSVVEASSASGAGIGSGGYDFNSDGDLFRLTGNACGDIEISGSTVTASSGNGAAGIGGGWGTPVGDVKIDNSTVTATGSSKGTGETSQGGAGIGGGHGESCGNISIKKSTVTVTGGNMSAAIGSSGDYDSTVTMWNTTCHSILIKGSTVTAKAGHGAAAIGTGMGAQFGKNVMIQISDSTVSAIGGTKGAGIGAGADAYAGSGGEACDILITGASKVTAIGGQYGAGIGGGFEGGADTIDIDLDDTKKNGNEWLYYVKATGGAGAAGIGSGGVDAEGEIKDGAEGGHDVDAVNISGGYVFAKGGRDDYGAGAGIGGGGRGGNINSFHVTGGFVEAHAGEVDAWVTSNAKADDIGTGGYDGRNAEDEDFKIIGGTVLGSLSDDPTIIIDGGSVRHKTTNAKRSDGTKVYRTTMQVVEGSYYEPPYLSVTSCDYKEIDIFTDENSRIYLYLPKSDTDAAKAQYYENQAYKYYYGTTTTDGNGWLKMGSQMAFKELEEQPTVGQKFTLYLDDTGMNGTIEFSVSGDDIAIDTTNTNETSSGAYVTLKANARTEYTVTAKTVDLASDLYWGTVASYTGKVAQDVAEIAITEDLSKAYDGTAVTDPDVQTNSNGKVSYTYYNGTEVKGAAISKPVNAGTYTVVASVEETEEYAGASAKRTFEIHKKDVALDITAVEDSETPTTVTVDVEVKGMVSAEGTIDLYISEESGTYSTQAKNLEVKSVDGKYKASATFTRTAASIYKVKAVYKGAMNHEASEAERQFNKEAAERTLAVMYEGNDVTNSVIATTYVYDEDSPEKSGILTVVPSDSTPSTDASSDRYLYEIVSDSLNGTGRETIALSETTGNRSECKIIFKNAGEAIVKITVSNETFFNDAVAYVKVVVNPKPIKIETYAYRTNDTQKTPVSSVQYGALDTLTYGIRYYDESVNPAKDITIDIGGKIPLTAVSLNETAGVNKEGYLIGIAKTDGTSETSYNVNNFKITNLFGKLIITPAPLYIQVNDALGMYGDDEPEYTCTFGQPNASEGLMDWDTKEDIIEEVYLSDGQKIIDYIELKPARYEAIITAGLKENPNYSVELQQGNLLVEKGKVLASVKASSKIYDKKTPNVDVSVIAGVSENIDIDKLQKPEEAIVTYYKSNDEGIYTKIEGTPINAGKYQVKVEVAENDYYESAKAWSRFRIFRAVYDIETPKVEDMLMKDGLTLADQPLPEHWEWLEPSKELQAGVVKAYAIYTLVDTENYFSVVRRITFNVYEEAVPDDKDPDDSDTPDASDNPDNSDTPDASDNPDNPDTPDASDNPDASGSNEKVVDTGDHSPITMILIFLTTSLVVIIGVLLFKRKK